MANWGYTKENGKIIYIISNSKITSMLYCYRSCCKKSIHAFPMLQMYLDTNKRASSTNVVIATS